MTYKIEEIEQSAFKIGLSKSIIKALIDNLPHKRSNQENKALHVLFQNIAFELNRLGYQYPDMNIVTGEVIEKTYTAEVVKEKIWKELQETMLAKTSTTQLTHNDIELIFEVIAQWLANKDIVVYFPSIESLQLKQQK